MNSGGAHLTFGINPDIAVFSKALGNGYPIAAIIGKGDIMESSQSSFISSTMWTERVGTVAALVTIKKHQNVNAAGHLMTIGKQVQDGWAHVAKINGLKIHIGGIPPLSHFSFEHDNALAIKALFIQLMLEKGYLASNLFYAMYAHQTYHVKQYLKAVDTAFAQMSEAIQAGNVEQQMKGKASTAGFKRLT